MTSGAVDINDGEGLAVAGDDATKILQLAERKEHALLQEAFVVLVGNPFMVLIRGNCRISMTYKMSHLCCRLIYGCTYLSGPTQKINF
jgi:hypothetical protein